MRVVSGSARGRKLKEPSGTAIMPSSAKVKESIFNIVQFGIEGRRVLDLFAGTGQLGIEALSRGAGSAVFVDSSPEALRLVRANLEICGFSGAAEVRLRDAMKYVEGPETFDLIFVDPPYGTPLAGETLAKIYEFDKLNENGIIICELPSGREAPAVCPPYALHREYKYGGVKVLKYVKAGV